MKGPDDRLNGAALKRASCRVILSCKLGQPKISDLPLAWTELWNYLPAGGVGLQQHSSQRVVLTLCHAIWTGTQDRSATMELKNRTTDSYRRARQEANKPVASAAIGDTSTPRMLNEQHLAEGTAHEIAMRLIKNDKRCSGDLEECCHEYVDEHSQTSRDYKLTPAQTLQSLHKILSKDTEWFYLDRV